MGFDKKMGLCDAFMSEKEEKFIFGIKNDENPKHHLLDDKLLQMIEKMNQVVLSRIDEEE